jgi:hypothetical protein
MNREYIGATLYRKAGWVRRIAALVLALTASSSCGSMVRQGTGSSYLIISTLQGASGANPVLSDVVTMVDGSPTVFNDLGEVGFTLGLKDPGSPTAPTTVSPNQFITVDRYRVTYQRADGRNVPGVDVPYSFDGGMTVTVSGGEVTAGFNLVRVQAKLEAPLRALRNAGAGIFSTIAEVTFFGHDQTGREVSVSGKLSVEFGDFADPSGS